MKGDSNRIIGIILIVIISFVYLKFFAPTVDQLEAQDQAVTADSTGTELVVDLEEGMEEADSIKVVLSDSAAILANANTFDIFAPASVGTSEIVSIENDVIKIDLDTKGGRIVSAWIKDYKRVIEGDKSEEIKENLYLLENEKNKFTYEFILNKGLKVQSEDLYFSASGSGQSLTLTANFDNGASFVQTYKLEEGSYNVDYNVQVLGLSNYLDLSAGGIRLNWVNYLSKLEKNETYERNYSTIYFKPAEDSADHCSCTGDDSESPEGKLKWISATNQFFNTSIIADTYFESGNFETEVLGEESKALKIVAASVVLPAENLNDFAMDMYIGPNQFENLQAYDVELTDIVPFGSSIFGTVNRWIIRPIFNFFNRYFNNLGIAIILLTLVVKLALYPLQYRMIHSQSKMGVLKPKLAALKEKYPDDSQKVQMETMKMYQEYGVNPLGGCMPIVLQMPIWFALYRFFPASIEFRQKGFL